MTKENDKIKFTLRMNEKQKRKLARLAEKAGVSQCQYLLGLLDGISFRPKPPQEFWELMKELSFLHKILLQFGEGKYVFVRAAERLEYFSEQLQKVMTKPEEVE